jgi:hypothetical protein
MSENAELSQYLSLTVTAHDPRSLTLCLERGELISLPLEWQCRNMAMRARSGETTAVKKMKTVEEDANIWRRGRIKQLVLVFPLEQTLDMNTTAILSEDVS